MLDFLSNSEKLVYAYIQKKSEDGPIREPYTQIAHRILQEYADSIPGRKKQDSSEQHKLFSEATVQRALKKMEKEGIISIVPSKEKTQTNEIVFHGLADEGEILSQIKSFASKLMQHTARMDFLHDKTKTEIDALRQTILDLEAERDALQKEKNMLVAAVQKIKNDAMIIPKDLIVSRSEESEVIRITFRK